MARLTLTRRTLLRGAGGVALSLPALEIMRGTARAAPVPRRYVVLFAGSSLGGNVKNTTVPNPLVVPAPGSPLASAYAFSPLEDFKVTAEVGAVSGLKIPWGTGTDLPPGGRQTGFHGSSAMPQLTGTPGVSGPKGPSSDQIVAAAIGGDTTFKSVALRVQPESYRSTANARGKMSWDSQARPIEPKVDPKAIFESLFSGIPPAPGGMGGDPNAGKALEAAYLRRKSILDQVIGNTNRLTTRLGRNDRATMERYLEELRDLERRLAPPLAPGAPGAGAPACGQLTPPGPVPAAGGGDYSNEDKRAELLGDYTALALACNRTRVVTLQYTWVQCFMSMVPLNGLQTDLHEASHAAGSPKDVADGVKWHMKHFARLVAKLRDTPEADGTSLLDNTALVFVFEGGHGFDPDAGTKISSHSSENMMVLYAGRAGGLKPGQHIVARDSHPAQVLLTAMNALGVASDKLGEVSGLIPGMRG